MYQVSVVRVQFIVQGNTGFISLALDSARARIASEQ
jgi:hypothetical protein